MLGYSLTDSRSGKATFYTGNLEESYMDSSGALQIIEKKFIEYVENLHKDLVEKIANCLICCLKRDKITENRLSSAIKNCLLSDIFF